MSEGYNGLPAYYVQSSDPITPNLLLSLKGMDPIVAENFVLIDNAVGSSSAVEVNSIIVHNPDFNNTTPTAPLGFTNVLWQVSGSFVSAYAPSGGGTPGGSNGDIQYNNSGSFGGSATIISAAGSIVLPPTQSISDGTTTFLFEGGAGFAIESPSGDLLLVGGGVELVGSGDSNLSLDIAGVSFQIDNGTGSASITNPLSTGTINFHGGLFTFDGGIVLNGATGGNEGNGTLNATGLFINGAPVGIAYTFFGNTQNPLTALVRPTVIVDTVGNQISFAAPSLPTTATGFLAFDPEGIPNNIFIAEYDTSLSEYSNIGLSPSAASIQSSDQCSLFLGALSSGDPFLFYLTNGPHSAYIRNLIAPNGETLVVHGSPVYIQDAAGTIFDGQGALPTGGSMGAGTLNTKGLYVNGVSVGFGTVTSVSFTGGLISVATPTTTPALTIAGTSGGIPYFSSASTWASSAVLPTGDFVLGGGSGSPPTASFSVVPVANGGTGTGSTLTGIVRGGNPFTASELSGDITTSGSNATTLATVNSNVGSFTYASITVNGKGLITAASNGTAPGTVSSFSSGNLSPLFTTSVATSTTTPALSFALSNAGGGTVFGNNTTGSAAPAYTTSPVLGIPGTSTGTIALASSTASGLFTVTAPTSAATPILTLPTNSGVLVDTGDGTLFPSTIPTSGALVLSTQTASTFFGGPASGPAAAPTFRALVTADIPSGTVLWNLIGNPSGNLSLSMGANTTTFSQTSNTPWLWANTTTATSGTTNASPILELADNYWTGAASAQDTWAIGTSLAAGTNGATTLFLQHTGGSTGQKNISTNANVLTLASVALGGSGNCLIQTASNLTLESTGGGLVSLNANSASANYNGSTFVFPSALQVNWNSDTTLSRNAAGVLQIGTNAANASGSLLCSAIALNGAANEGAGTINLATYYSGGTVGVSAGSFASITAITTKGGIVTQLTGTSDERLKDSQPYEGGLEEILEITPARYRWNAKGQEHTGMSGGIEYVGFLAQDVQKAIPEAITAKEKSKDGTEEYLSFDDRPVLAAAVNAIKEMHALMMQLKKDNEELKSTVEDQSSRIEKLEKLLCL